MKRDLELVKKILQYFDTKDDWKYEKDSIMKNVYFSFVLKRGSLQQDYLL